MASILLSFATLEESIFMLFFKFLILFLIFNVILLLLLFFIFYYSSMQRDFSIKFCLSSIPSGALLSHMLKKIKVIDSATLMCCGVDLFSLKSGLWLKLRAQAPAPGSGFSSGLWLQLRALASAPAPALAPGVKRTFKIFPQFFELLKTSF